MSTYAHSMASAATIADDAVQETFLRAWTYLDSFGGSGSFEGWLIRICRHALFDLESKERRAASLTEAVPVTNQAADYRPETMTLLSALPRDQRAVLVVCGVLGYDYEAAADVLDIPVGTVRSRLHRARAAMAAAMTHDVEATA